MKGEPIMIIYNNNDDVLDLLLNLLVDVYLESEEETKEEEYNEN